MIKTHLDFTVLNNFKKKHDKRIELFGMLESQDTHDLITNVLLECVMQSIEEMVRLCNM